MRLFIFEDDLFADNICNSKNYAILNKNHIPYNVTDYWNRLFASCEILFTNTRNFFSKYFYSELLEFVTSN